MAAYRVTAGYVTVETRVPGGRAAIDIPRGAELPDDVPAEQLDALLRQGHLEAADPEPAPEPEQPETGPDNRGPHPPRSGAGSSRDAWAAWAATEHGFIVPEDATREQIINALTEAGILTE